MMERDERHPMIAASEDEQKDGISGIMITAESLAMVYTDAYSRANQARGRPSECRRIAGEAMQDFAQQIRKLNKGDHNEQQ